MAEHPFTESASRKATVLLIWLLLAAAMATLLAIYGGITPAVAIADALLYTATFAVLAYLYWHVIGFFQVVQSQVVIAIAVQVICIATTFAILSVFELEDLQTFTYLIPIRMATTILSWIILQQWYNINQAKKQPPESEKMQEDEPKGHRENANQELSETLDRISVKDGTKIHIVMVADILYAQAYGDYVTLFTSTGKYVKEVTMKYLEANLPDTFVRIHRSYIVNIGYIVRIELFGKQTHQVRLKNNTCLRISSNGYKLLKDALML